MFKHKFGYFKSCFVNVEQPFTTRLFMYLCDDFILTHCHDTAAAAPQQALF